MLFWKECDMFYFLLSLSFQWTFSRVHFYLESRIIPRWIIILKRKEKGCVQAARGNFIRLIATKLCWYPPLKCSFRDQPPSCRMASIFTLSTYYVVMSPLRKIYAFAFKACLTMQARGPNRFARRILEHQMARFHYLIGKNISIRYRERKKKERREKTQRHSHVCNTQPQKFHVTCHASSENISPPCKSTPRLRFLSNSIYIEKRGTSSRILRARRRLWLSDPKEIEREKERERERESYYCDTSLVLE